jgi:acyl-CoA reductase-like NAD-dependent aldehyde dehydrogenase
VEYKLLIDGQWVDKITFTGSPDVGRHVISVAGTKKVTLEPGNSSPVGVAPDADLNFVARRAAIGAYYNSG